MSGWILLLALLVGVLLGTLGGGGAILTVPILTVLLRQDAHAATAGSLLIVGLSSLVGMVSHARAGHVRGRDGVTFGALGVVGALAGSRLSVGVPGPVLMSAFAVLLAVVAGVMLRRRFATREERVVARGWPARIAAATGVGLLTGFFGVGGGFVIVPALTLVMGIPMAEAVGTSLLVIAINSATSLTMRFAHGLRLDWPVILPFALLTVVGTLIGARLSRRIPAAALTLAFAMLLLVVAVAVGAANIPRLFA